MTAANGYSVFWYLDEFDNFFHKNMANLNLGQRLGEHTTWASDFKAFQCIQRRKGPRGPGFEAQKTNMFHSEPQENMWMHPSGLPFSLSLYATA